MNTASIFDQIACLTFAQLCERFPNDGVAAVFLERVRWPNGPACAHCQSSNVGAVIGGSRNRAILYCRDCEKQFSVTVGTIMEDAKIPLHKWLWAIHLMCASKKGVSALQLQRMLGLAYRSAWHLAHRIRHAMAVAPVGKLTGTVEADETYVGGKRRGMGRGYRGNKATVFTVVQRDGSARSFHVLGAVCGKNLGDKLKEHVAVSAALMTDESPVYTETGKDFASHETVNHSAKEYARGCCHTNTAEGFFANLKRGLDGTFHHVSQKHLGRYLSEFDYKYNTRKIKDGQRMIRAVVLGNGKRLYLFRASHRPESHSTQDWAL